MLLQLDVSNVETPSNFLILPASVSHYCFCSCDKVRTATLHSYRLCQVYFTG